MNTSRTHGQLTSRSPHKCSANISSKESAYLEISLSKERSSDEFDELINRLETSLFFRISFGLTTGNFVLPLINRIDDNDQSSSENPPLIPSQVKQRILETISKSLKNVSFLLNSLDLNEADIKDEGAIILGSSLAMNHSLEQLDLRKNSIGDEGAKALFNGLEKNITMKRLQLSCNNIGFMSLACLRFLEKSSTAVNGATRGSVLLELDLSDNNIGSKGAKIISEILIKNTSLEILSLARNSIGDEGCQQVAESIMKNKSLSELILDGNQFTHKGIMSLAESLNWNRSLTNLSLGSEPTIEDAGPKSLLAALTSNYSINKGVFNIGSASFMKSYSDLRKRNSGLRDQLHNAVRSGQSATIIKLLQLRLSPLCRLEEGNCTLLHTAASSGVNDAIIDMLLKAGIHFGSLNFNGETALELAKKIPRTRSPLSLIARLFICWFVQLN